MHDANRVCSFRLVASSRHRSAMKLSRRTRLMLPVRASRVKYFPYGKSRTYVTDGLYRACIQKFFLENQHMATRTADLYPAATAVADRLTKRVGNQKLILSAGVIVLAMLEAEDREVALSLAMGESDQGLDLYAGRKALLAIQNELASMRLEDARSGGGQLLLDDVLRYVEPLIANGLSSRVSRVHVQITESAAGDIHTVCERMKSAVRQISEAEYQRLPEEEQRMVDAIRLSAGDSGLSADQKAQMVVRGAEAHARGPGQTRGRRGHRAG